MRFLVDAQLPRRLAYFLRNAGHDVLHSGDLPLQNRTPDEAINQLSLADERVVITKDSDFVSSHLIHKKPYKLLLVATGNISNDDLLRMFEQNLGQIAVALKNHTYIELDRSHLIIHQ